MRKNEGTAVALPVAVLALTLLVPVMVARHVQGSHTRGNVGRTVRGGVLVDLCRAAVTEGWWQLERASADVADPLYLKLRGHESSEQKLVVPVPLLDEKMKAEVAFAGCKLQGGGVACTLRPMMRTSNRTREGVCDVVLEAKLLHEPTGLVRTVRETREMRMVLLGLPPPFDEPTLAVLDAAALVGPQTNAWMEEAVSLVGQIATAAKAAGASELGGEPPAPLVDDLSKEIHRFPSKYVVRTAAAQVADLSQLNLAPRIESIRRRIESMGPPTNLAGQAAGDPEGAGRKARELAQAHVSLLEEARGFQKVLEEAGGADADGVTALSGQLAPSEWRRRALFAFDGKGAAKRFLAMLDAYEAEGRPVSGVVFLDNRDYGLKLTRRTIRGRLVICATGSVELEEVRLANRATDALIVQSERLMMASGRVEAALVARGGVSFSPDLVLAGSLILSEVRPDDQLAGRIDSDAARLHARIDGADRPEMFQLAFAPTASRRELIAP